jgi:hypothetical protein
MLRFFIFLSLLLGANTFSNQKDYHSEIFEYKGNTSSSLETCDGVLTKAE